MTRGSCIQHPPYDRVAVIRQSYFDITEDVLSAAIVGIFHQWWCAGEDTTSTTTEIAAALLGISKEKAIRKRLAALIEKELLLSVLLSASDAKALVICRKVGDAVPRSTCQRFSACEWCGAIAVVMHDHHYPIKASRGGKEVVSICPSCHADYHALIDSRIFKPSRLLVSRFESWPHALEGVQS